MQALVLRTFGGIDQLTLSEVPTPVPAPDEVLVEVKALSINPVDVRTRAGSAMAEHLKQFQPLILGWDISGVVTQTGPEVTEFAPGDEVFGLVNFLGHGQGYADFVAAPARQLALKPASISHEEAAAVPLAALTAWQLLYHYAQVKSGDRVLIQAASGGVGHYAVQLAKHLGAYVIGVSSAKNRAFVLGLGADEHIAYDEQRVADVVTDMDVVLDAFANDSLFDSLKMVRQGGILLSLLPMISPDVLAQAKTRDVKVHYALVHSSGEDMQQLAGLLARGFLTSHVGRVFPFDQLGQAHLAVETGRTVGKVVVQK